MNPRIGLIIPSGNRLTEPQFQRYAPDGIGVHVTRLRMTGPWHRPLHELEAGIAEAAAVLSDTRPGVIVFHCTANSMAEGLAGEAFVLEIIGKASQGCPAVTTGRAITEALARLELRKIVLISPYVAETNRHEIRFLGEAGVEVVHDIGLGLQGGEAFVAVTPEQWKAVALANRRADADGYLLSCTNTTMIDVIEDLEERLGKPVVTSNQAALWSALRTLGMLCPIAALGRLFHSTIRVPTIPSCS